MHVAIWEQGAVVPWQARHGLDAAGYQQTFDDLRYQGYQPVVVSGYSFGDAAEYAALWQNYAMTAADLDEIDSAVNATLKSTGAPADLAGGHCAGRAPGVRQGLRRRRS